MVLSSMYPRRELTGDMEEMTLGQLGLAPSGVVVVRLNRVRIYVVSLPLVYDSTILGLSYYPRP